jgi:hypothetical protein
VKRAKGKAHDWEKEKKKQGKIGKNRISSIAAIDLENAPIYRVFALLGRRRPRRLLLR